MGGFFPVAKWSMHFTCLYTQIHVNVCCSLLLQPTDPLGSKCKRIRRLSANIHIRCKKTEVINVLRWVGRHSQAHDQSIYWKLNRFRNKFDIKFSTFLSNLCACYFGVIKADNFRGLCIYFTFQCLQYFQRINLTNIRQFETVSKLPVNV